MAERWKTETRAWGEEMAAKRMRKSDPKAMRAVVTTSTATVLRTTLTKMFSTAQRSVARRIKSSPREKEKPVKPPIIKLLRKRRYRPIIWKKESRSLRIG